MAKTAIFGGTFNPVHLGHVNFCRECDRIFSFDRILLIPTKSPVHKVSADLASGADRIEMLSITVQEMGLEHYTVSDMEVNSDRDSYTVYTIEELRERYPNDELYLLIGSDMFFIFDRWYRYEDILQNVTLVVAARENSDMDKLHAKMQEIEDKAAINGKIKVININVLELSSTEIRQKVSVGEDINGLVCDGVRQYILQNNLYRLG